MVTNATPWIEGDVDAGDEGRWGEPAYYLVVNGATKWEDIGHLREFIDDDVTLTHMDEHALIALQGPSAATALNRVMRNVIDDMVFMESVTHEFGEWPLRITRSGYTGEDGSRQNSLKAWPIACARKSKCGPSALAHATACGSKPAFRSMATTSRPIPTRCLPISVSR